MTWNNIIIIIIIINNYKSNIYVLQFIFVILTTYCLWY